ncbi:MAG: EVE domain-containing protein [Chloroflexi bacterium]|nr:EVE domain-containing protein [Chloroflexota bacterium]
MHNCWLVVGLPHNWKTAFEHKNIWGLKQTQRHLWNRLNEGDVLLFYVTSPVSGVIGYGTVRIKFHQDQPLWPQEIEENEVIWPLRFEFNVERCLPFDKWPTSKVTSRELFPRGGFQTLSHDIAQELVSKLKSLPRTYYVRTPTVTPATEALSPYLHGAQQAEQVLPSHKELKQKLVEIGKLQGYLADEEYVFDIGKLDVVWRRVALSVPTYAFEIQVGGDIYHALAKLKHASDIWNSNIFIVAPQTDHGKFEGLLSGTFHEISNRVKFIELNKVDELYKRKKAYSEFEKELGI